MAIHPEEAYNEASRSEKLQALLTSEAAERLRVDEPYYEILEEIALKQARVHTTMQENQLREVGHIDPAELIERIDDLNAQLAQEGQPTYSEYYEFWLELRAHCLGGSLLANYDGSDENTGIYEMTRDGDEIRGIAVQSATGMYNPYAIAIIDVANILVLEKDDRQYRVDLTAEHVGLNFQVPGQ